MFAVTEAYFQDLLSPLIIHRKYMFLYRCGSFQQLLSLFIQCLLFWFYSVSLNQMKINVVSFLYFFAANDRF